jgi:hypothetical protein
MSTFMFQENCYKHRHQHGMDMDEDTDTDTDKCTDIDLDPGYGKTKSRMPTTATRYCTFSRIIFCVIPVFLPEKRFLEIMYPYFRKIPQNSGKVKTNSEKFRHPRNYKNSLSWTPYLSSPLIAC